MKKNRWLIAFFSITCACASALAIPNTGVDAGTLPEGILFARNRFFYVDYDGPYNESLGSYSNFLPGEYYHAYWNLTEIAYGITSKWTCVLNLWYYDASINTTAIKGHNSGAGDFYFFSKNKIIESKENPEDALALLWGARFPTGEYKELPLLRFGSGAYYAGLGVTGTKKVGPLTNSLFLGYWINSKNHNAADKRDEFEVRTTTEYALLKRVLNVQLEFKGLFFESGERVVEIVPGIQYTPIFPLTFQASCKIPIEQKYYYKYDCQWVFGVSFGLPVKPRAAH